MIEWVIDLSIFILVRRSHQTPKLTKWTFNLKPSPPNLPYNTLRIHISRSSKESIWLACFLGDCLLIKLISISLLHDSFCSKPQNPSWSSKIDMSFINKQSPKKQAIMMNALLIRCKCCSLSCFGKSIGQCWTRLNEDRIRIWPNGRDIDERRLNRLVLKVRTLMISRNYS